MKGSVIVFILCGVALTASFVHEVAYNDDKCSGDKVWNRYFANDTCMQDPSAGSNSIYFYWTCEDGAAVKHVCDAHDST